MTVDLSPEWPEIIKEAARKSLDGVHTSLPGKVVSYDRVTKTCTVETASDELPILEDVPVSFPRGGGGFIHFDLTAGDGGLVTFCEIDFSHWRTLGTKGPPNILVRHGLWGVFTSGLSDDLDALTVPTGMSIGNENGSIIRCQSTVNVQAAIVPSLTMPAVALIRKDKFDTYCQALETALNSVVTGSGATLSALRSSIGTISLKAE